MKVIIAGSRDFNDYNLLKRVCDIKLSNQPVVEVISGNANGADKLGERYAYDNGYNVLLFPADWNTLGKGAGFIRNKEMAKHADAAIIFWDGFSKGSKNMIDICKKLKLKLQVVYYKEIRQD